MIIPTHLQMARNSHIFLCSYVLARFLYLVLNLHTKGGGADGGCCGNEMESGFRTFLGSNVEINDIT